MFDHVKFGVSDYAASKAFFCRPRPLGVTLIGEGEPSYGAELAGSGDASMPLSKCGKTGAAALPFAPTAASRSMPSGRRRWPPEEQRRAGATAKLPRQLLRRVCDCARRAQY